jgi:hypothetical protein
MLRAVGCGPLAGTSKQVADVRDNFPANRCEKRSQDTEKEIAQRKAQGSFHLGNNVIAENRAGHCSRYDGRDIKSGEPILHRCESLQVIADPSFSAVTL